MDNFMPLVSIIIPIYKVEKYLPECLESVINLTYKNLEIILVDDGSPDNCGKICDEYAVSDSRVKVIHKTNGGVSSARNAGIEAATGEWIYFLDPDDIIEKDLIELALGTALSDGTDMCFFDYEDFNEKGSIKKCALMSVETIFKNIDSLETFITYFSAAGFIWDFIIRANIIKNKIKFDESISFSEDELFKFQVYGQINSFSYLHKVLYHYRISENSACGSIIKRKNYPDMMLGIHRKMVETVSTGNYPENAVIVANTRLISRFCVVVMIAFQNRFSFKCNFKIIKAYMLPEEYRQARLNYDKETVQARSNVLYASLKKPNRFIITLIYLLTKIKSVTKKI